MSEHVSNEGSFDNNIDYKKKIIFIGDASTGKTSIINRIHSNFYDENIEATIGVDFVSKNIRFHGQSIKLQLWDTCGLEKYKGLIPSYIRNSLLVFAVYDISRKYSFVNVQNWINFVKSIENTKIVLCGNKSDLSSHREVEAKEGQEMAEKEGIKFFECSAKTNDNIKYMFFSSIAELSIFEVNEEINKENLIKELIEENNCDENQEIINDNFVMQQNNLININEKGISTKNKKRRCGC